MSTTVTATFRVPETSTSSSNRSTMCLQTLCRNIVSNFSKAGAQQLSRSTFVNGVMIVGDESLPAPFATFLPASVVLFHGVFTETAAMHFGNAFSSACAVAATTDKIVTVVVNSCGGDVRALLLMVAALDENRMHYPGLIIEMLALQDCCSCGFVFLMNADVIYHSAGTRFLCHQPYSQVNEHGIINCDTLGIELSGMSICKDRTYRIAESGLFSRVLRNMDGFLQMQGYEITEQHELLLAKIQELVVEIDTGAKALTVDMGPDAQQSLAVHKKRSKLAVLLRKRWLYVAKPALTSRFGANETVFPDELNIFQIVTVEYAKDPNTLFLSNADMKNFYLMPGLPDYVHTYDIETTIKRSVKLTPDIDIVRVVSA
jgi:hypothetical protein